jgi:hypothetical protein
MAQMLNFTEAGELRTDEKVVCDEAVVIGALTYYKGYLNYIGNRAIAGNTSSTYGVYTAVSKGGTRLNVLIAGPPAGAAVPGDVNTISYDPQNGVCYTTTSRTVYFTYLGHGPIDHGSSDTVIDMNGGTATAGVTKTFHAGQSGQFRSWSRADANPGFGFRAPSSNATITISNGTESETITVPSSGSASTMLFSDILKCTAAQTLTVSTTNGYDMNNWQFTLRGPG